MTYSLEPGTIYVQNFVPGKPGELYVLDLKTGNTTRIGKLATEVYDLAFVDDSLYGLSKKDFGFRKTMKLIKINPATGSPQTIGDTQFNVVGLAYNPVSKILCATAHKDSKIVQINLETGRATEIALLSDRDRQCGEIAFDAAGKTYITLIGTDFKKYLATCDLTTGTVALIGDIGFPGLASMKFIGDTLYGVVGQYKGVGGTDGQVIRMDTTTGQGTLVTTTRPALCWAGMAIYAGHTIAVPAGQPESSNVPSSTEEEASQQNPPTDDILSRDDSKTQETAMALLTIDTKSNCYVINPDEMNSLQQTVASSFICDQGTFDIAIQGGRYSYNAAQSEGEPTVLLWIYGLDGSTFVNNNTGIEVGTTWTTLNGMGDRLQIRVKKKAVICALFFDTNSADNSGTVEVSINSNKPYFQPRTLSVDSQRNCYVLDSGMLTSLQQAQANVVELQPGNYRIKIRESNASYWSSEKKFELEPWALLWIQGGKFTPKFTSIDVSETWCSLNGLADQVVLEVKDATTVSGFFFDTYKEDNEGQIILDVEPISGGDLIELRRRFISIRGGSDEDVQGGSGGSGGSGGDQREELVDVRTSGDDRVLVGGGSGMRFNFQLDQDEIEQAWRQIAERVETSVSVRSEQDTQKEAYWDNLEKWILKSYQQQAKEMAIKVARVEFMMKAFTQQVEGSFNQIFQGWSGYFDTRLTDIIDSQLPRLIEERISLKLSEQAQAAKKLVLDQIQSDIEGRIGTAINLRLSQQTQDIKQLVVEQLQGEIDRRIETAVSSRISDHTPEMNRLIIEQIQGEMDKRIDAIVVLKINAQTEQLKTMITQQLQADLDQRVDAAVRLKMEALTDTVRSSIFQQIQTDLEQRLEALVNLKLTDQTENLKALITRQIEANIDQRIQVFVEQWSDRGVSTVINNIMGDIDDRINANFETKIFNFRQDLSTFVSTEINEGYTENLKASLLAEIRNQQFYLDMQSIRAEVMNFYGRLGQFETQLNLRIAQGDARLYNWTLEQLTALQACMTDRQALVDMMESFTSRLKNALDDAPCVQPSRFTVIPDTLPELGAGGTGQLPGSPQSGV